MLRAVDQYSRVTTKTYETERDFLRDLELFRKSGQKIEAWVLRCKWEEYSLQ